MEKEKNISIKEIKARKKALEEEIDRLENKYAKKSERMKKRVDSTLKPIKRIKEHPFASIGLAVFAGFIIGLPGRRKRKSDTASDTDKFSSMVATELKLLAARRTIDFVSEFVDNKVMPRIRKKSSKQDD